MKNISHIRQFLLKKVVKKDKKTPNPNYAEKILTSQ